MTRLEGAILFLGLAAADHAVDHPAEPFFGRAHRRILDREHVAPGPLLLEIVVAGRIVADGDQRFAEVAALRKSVKILTNLMA